MNFLLEVLKGMIIGIGAVAPGVSGGTFAVVLGVYDKITSAIANIFTDLYGKIISLMPLGIGVGIGVLGFSRIIQSVFENYGAQIKFLFIGLMLGTLPSVVREANKRGFKRVYLIPCVLTLAITIGFTILENSVIDIIPENSPSILNLMIYGAIIGFGTIIPGISSSFILMYIGAYEMILNGIANIDLRILIPAGLGFGVSILVFAKVINILFKRFYGYTYYVILGFVGGSIITIFPELEMNLSYLMGILLGVIGFFISFKLCNYQKKEISSNSLSS